MSPTQMQAGAPDLCVILGNGPSLRGFDLTRLTDVATLGMNAAYRHWDQIGWYPTIYACLDDQLILTHHAEIHRLWAEGRIGTFFLEGSFFDLHPDCINAPGFHSLDQMVAVLYRKRGQAQGWPALYDQPAFRTADHNKITTGAWACRFAAWTGHRTLAIMGVDLKYVEILPEADRGDGVTLVMRETPARNPNYFFDGYQQAGDRYNIPNPAQHDHALHIDSFRLVSADFAANAVDCRLFNTNPASLLEDRRVFPLCPVERFLTPAGIDAVVVPAHAGEVAAIIDNFRIWADPGHQPGLLPGGRPRLVLAFNNDQAQPRAGDITAAFDRWQMGRFFQPPEFWYFDLTGAADRYERDFSKAVDEQGYKAGPNNLFFATMRRAADLGLHVFQMETDCAPLAPGWLAALDAEVRARAPFWVLGSRYHGVHRLSPVFRDHLNGNAVYATGDPAFRAFLDGFWEPQTRRLVAGVDARLAYDCILSKLFVDERADNPDVDAAFLLTRGVLCPTTVIVNNSGAEDVARLPPGHLAALRARFPRAAILHNRAARNQVAAAVPRLPEAPRLLVIDMTPAGSGSATGALKATLLSGWPADRLLQVAAPLPDRLSLVFAGGGADWNSCAADPDTVRAAVDAFAPDLILYRPLPERPALQALAQDLLAARPDLPLITWIMDDWPARLAGDEHDARLAGDADDPGGFARWDAALRALFARAALNLSISDAMSQAFAARYGVPFQAFANAVDPADWPPRPAGHDRPAGATLLVRYAGGLAPDMNAHSLQRIAQAIAARRAAGQKIRFEISTRPHWQKVSGALFDGLDGTRIDVTERSAADYRAWISGADVLVIAYNFDPASMDYVRYSLANKLPECLLSGAALLVHGPAGLATTDRLATVGDAGGGDVAALVLTPDPAALQTALEGLADPDRRRALAQAARAFGTRDFALDPMRDRFGLALAGLVTQARPLPDAGAHHLLAALRQSVQAGAAAPAAAVAGASERTLTWQLQESRAALDRLQQALDASRAAQQGAQAELAHVYRSHSWRVTAPLRGLRRWLGRNRGAGGGPA